MSDAGRLSPEISWFPPRVGGAEGLLSQHRGVSGSWKACPHQVSARGLVQSFKTLSRGAASRPLLSQTVLAGFSKVCSCLLPAQPHPRPGPAVLRGPASVGDAVRPVAAAERAALSILKLQVSSKLQELCKVGQLRVHASPLDFSLPGSPAPPPPTLPSTGSCWSQRSGSLHLFLVLHPEAPPCC